MIEMILHKSQGGRDQVKTFSNRYLFAGNNQIESDEMIDLTRDLMGAEQLLFPTDTNFVRAVVREVTAQVAPIKGRTRSFPLEGAGLFVVPAGDKLAPAHICAVVERAAILGRPGYGYYRHCVTAGEYEAWLNDRTVPARFNANYTANGTVYGNIWLAFLDGLNIGALQPVLPDAWGDLLDTPRQIKSMKFGGFRINDPVRPKKSHRAKSIDGFQGEINELARRARQAYKEWTDGTVDVGDVAVIVDLATEAAKIYFSLPISLRGALKWPKIFKALPPVNPGNLPQLPF